MSISSTNALDGSHSIQNANISIYVGVEKTQDVLKLLWQKQSLQHRTTYTLQIYYYLLLLYYYYQQHVSATTTIETNRYKQYAMKQSKKDSANCHKNAIYETNYKNTPNEFID